MAVRLIPAPWSWPQTCMVLTRLPMSLAISHSPPRQDQRAVEVPPKLKKHLGLDTQPSWIYTGELNIFAWPGPDLRPAGQLSTRPSASDSCVIGPLPSDWFEMIKAHVLDSQRLQHLDITKRTV